MKPLYEFGNGPDFTENHFKYSPDGGDDLATALYYNDVDEFPLSDLAGAQVLLEITGEHDGADWHWIVKHRDGHFAYISGGCDYTGWDCQSFAEAHKADTFEEVLKLVGETVRSEFEDMIEKGEQQRDNDFSW